MSETEDLRRLAEAATPRGIEQAGSDGRSEWRAFWTAASPDVVLGLLDRLAAAEGAVARVRAYVAKWIGDELNTAIDKEAAAYCLQDALDGPGAPATVEVDSGSTGDGNGAQIGSNDRGAFQHRGGPGRHRRAPRSAEQPGSDQPPATDSGEAASEGNR